MGYVRFVVHLRDADSTVRSGVFQAIEDLLKLGRLSTSEARRLRELEDWFNRNLSRPKRFSKKRNPNPRGNRGISWFKDSATHHLAQMRDIVAILETHEVAVEMLATDTPGYVLYEDDIQVVAEPFTGTPT